MGKSVNFCQQPERLIEIESHHEMTEEQRKDTWYTRNELARNQEEDRRGLQALERGVPPGDFEPRGLESWSPEQKFARRTTTINVVQAVLDEADRQRRDCIIDDEIVATICRELTHDSRKTARKLGKKDAASIPEVAAADEARRKLKKELMKKELLRRESEKRSRKAPIDRQRSSRKTTFSKIFDLSRRRAA